MTKPPYMNPTDVLPVDAFWPMITRLGESQILLPAAALVGVVLYRQARSMALRWGAGLALAILLTTASKLAYIGWGIGWDALDFTGFSGHSMVAAGVYPMLFAVMFARMGVVGWRAASMLGFVLALVVGYSRIAVHAHSWSEVISGLALGAAASAWPLVAEPRGRVAVLVGPIVPVLLAVWLLLTPAQMPPNQTHSLVIRMALALSGRSMPYTRDHLQSRPKAQPQQNADEKKPAP